MLEGYQNVQYGLTRDDTEDHDTSAQEAIPFEGPAARRRQPATAPVSPSHHPHLLPWLFCDRAITMNIT